MHVPAGAASVHETPATPSPGSRGVWVLPLPYTSPPLTLNNRSHWSKVAATAAQLKADAYYLAKAHKVPALERITVTLIFWPGNNTVHDADNLAATMKPLVDGLRQAGVVADDRGRHVRQAAQRVIERADDPEDRADARMALVVRAL
jgi:crossover junction endodeoxyribonuclease RusA